MPGSKVTFQEKWGGSSQPASDSHALEEAARLVCVIKASGSISGFLALAQEQTTVLSLHAWCNNDHQQDSVPTVL